MKKKVISLLIATLLIATQFSFNCKASEQYNLNICKNITMKKGSNIKLQVNGSGKKKIKLSKKNIVSVNKKLQVKAKRCGKVKLVIKVQNKKYTCFVTVKKNIKKASSKTVYAVSKGVKNNIINYRVYNKSDQWITLVNPLLQFKENNKWSYEAHKDNPVDVGVFPYIYVAPHKSYQTGFDLSSYKMNHSHYRVVYDGVYIGTGFKNKLKKSVGAEFDFVK